MTNMTRKSSFITYVIGAVLIAGLILMPGCSKKAAGESGLTKEDVKTFLSYDPADYDEPYVEINGNKPTFTDEELDDARDSYEEYGELDKKGRCTEVMASLSSETQPEEGEQREDISYIHPSGWQYDQGWERMHLIAWSLGAENDNERNLVTGTHYCNTEGMLPYEVEVSNYIRYSGNHVLYRVQPIFKDDELVCRGVHMEAMSVEDEGDEISFNIYCFNYQPGKEIDYGRGYVSNAKEKGLFGLGEKKSEDSKYRYILNTRSMKIHYPECEGAVNTAEHNKQGTNKSREELIKEGYEPCGSCNP